MTDEDVVVKHVCMTKVYLNPEDEIVVMQRDYFGEDHFVFFPKDAAIAVALRIQELAEEL